MAPAPGYANRSPRIDIRRAAALVRSDGAECAAQFLDISSGGCRIKVEQPVLVGEFVTLRVERSREFPAQIRWVEGNEAGAVFLAPVQYPILK